VDCRPGGLATTPRLRGKALTDVGQIWGFAVIDGQRRYTRRIKFEGPQGEDVEAQVVYNYSEYRSGVRASLSPFNADDRSLQLVPFKTCRREVSRLCTLSLEADSTV
jgi:hypothetical protein